jgi:hypothetical protein
MPREARSDDEDASEESGLGGKPVLTASESIGRLVYAWTSMRTVLFLGRDLGAGEQGRVQLS